MNTLYLDKTKQCVHFWQICLCQIDKQSDKYTYTYTHIDIYIAKNTENLRTFLNVNNWLAFSFAEIKFGSERWQRSWDLGLVCCIMCVYIYINILKLCFCFCFIKQNKKLKYILLKLGFVQVMETWKNHGILK